MGPRHEEGLENETNFFINCEHEKEELSEYQKDKVEGEQILDAIGSKKFLMSVGKAINTIQFGESIKFSDAFSFW